MKRFAVLVSLVACVCLLAGCGTAVPDVKGMTPEQASGALESAGFKAAALSYDEAAVGATGAVVLQDPVAGGRADAGSLVSLTVAGPPPVRTPELVGLTSSEASAALGAIGLVLGDTTRVFSGTVPAGHVVSQLPEVGQEVPKGSRVALVVSKGPGPEPVAVPPVKGESESKAKSKLKAAGFKVSVSRRNDDAKKGTVIGQKPSKGNALPGSTVRITVSSGVAMVRVPNITGMMDPDPVIRRAGLIPKGIAIHGPIESDARGIGEAYRQRPRAGSLVPKGTTVTYHFWWEMG